MLMRLGELSCAFSHSGSFQHYALMFMPYPIWRLPLAGFTGLAGGFSLTVEQGLLPTSISPSVPVYIFCLALLLILTVINLISAKSFGECKYWL